MASQNSGIATSVEPHDGQVRYVDTCTLIVTRDVWPFAVAHAAEIDAFWQRRTAENAALFNGRIFMLSRFELENCCFMGWLIPVDFASFLYWKESGTPDRSIFDVFGSALIRADDGAILLGRQRAGNINAGLVYLPGGFIDPRDIDTDGHVDIAASVLREVQEETGLGGRQLAVRDGFLITTIGQQISIAVEVVGDGNAAVLQRRIRDALAADVEPELDDIVTVREWADVAALPVPEYAQVLLAHLFGAHLPNAVEQRDLDKTN